MEISEISFRGCFQPNSGNVCHMQPQVVKYLEFCMIFKNILLCVTYNGSFDPDFLYNSLLCLYFCFLIAYSENMLKIM